MTAQLPSGSCSAMVEERVRTEQLRLLYGHGPIALVASLAAAAFLFAFVHTDLSPSSQLAWPCLFAAVTVLRAALYVWRANRPNAVRPTTWLRLFAGGAFLAGASWGASAMWFFPEGTVRQFLVTVAVMGMVAGAATSMSCVPWVYLLFMLPALLPVAGHLAMVEPSIGPAIAGLALIYCAGMMLIARTNRHLLIQSLRLRFKNIELAQELETLATRDALTGLPNRLILAERMDGALKRAQRSENDVAVVFVDCDHFKEINDSYGHAAGDAYLQRVGSALQRAVRTVDTVARLGGDEFIVLLESYGDRAQLEAIVQRMRMHALQPFTLAEAAVSPQLSIGVACYPADGRDVDTLIRCADHAMYTAKRNGGNAVHYYEDLTGQQAKETG